MERRVFKPCEHWHLRLRTVRVIPDPFWENLRLWTRSLAEALEGTRAHLWAGDGCLLVRRGEFKRLSPRTEGRPGRENPLGASRPRGQSPRLDRGRHGP